MMVMVRYCQFIPMCSVFDMFLHNDIKTVTVSNSLNLFCQELKQHLGTHLGRSVVQGLYVLDSVRCSPG